MKASLIKNLLQAFAIFFKENEVRVVMIMKVDKLCLFAVYLTLFLVTQII
jgi:hypothetical protein